MASSMVMYAGLNPYVKQVGTFYGIILIIAGVILSVIYLPSTIVLFVMAALLLVQIYSTHVELRKEHLILKSFGRTIQEVNIHDIERINNFKFHNCYIDYNKSRIYSFDVYTNDDEIHHFSTGCIKGCEMIDILDQIYQEVFDQKFDIITCDNKLSHLEK